MTDSIRIATRESQLALWQAEHVAARLAANRPDLTVELVPMTTTGDRILGQSLARIGGKGLFIKELEIAMVEARADIAVHSMKDVPVTMPDGFVLGAILKRASPDDAFVSNRFDSLEALPQKARVGTSSLRRQSQIRHARPDLDVSSLRGNVNTRLRKLDDGDFDAILLAVAGLERLEFAERISQTLNHHVCLPAIGQGAIGIECRADDVDTRTMVAELGHEDSHSAVAAERSLSLGLDGSCTSPIAGHATLDGDALHLSGVVALPDGSRLLRGEVLGHRDDAEQLANNSRITCWPEAPANYSNGQRRPPSERAGPAGNHSAGYPSARTRRSAVRTD